MKLHIPTAALLSAAALALSMACSGDDKTTIIENPPPPPKASYLEYANPPATGAFSLVRNSSSTQDKLVLDLVANGASGPSNGVAFSITLNNPDTADWVKVGGSDAYLVQNGGVFEVEGENPQVKAFAAKLTGNVLKAVVSQKMGESEPADIGGGVIARIALKARQNASEGTVGLTVNKFQMIPEGREVVAIDPADVLVGTITHSLR